MDLQRLDELPRAELIELGRRHGIERPERMTRVELRDELVRVTISDENLRQRTRGWFGVARDLVASVVEAGLHMPDAAKVIRGEEGTIDPKIKRPPVATVTLAEIYAAQGHVRRAMKMLDQVLTAEPDHEVAQLLRERLKERLGETKANGSVEPEAPGEPAAFSRSPDLGDFLRDRFRAAAEASGASPPIDEPDEPPESGEVEVQAPVKPALDAPVEAVVAQSSEALAPAPQTTQSAPEASVEPEPEPEPEQQAEPAQQAEAESQPVALAAAEPAPRAEPEPEPEPKQPAEVEVATPRPALPERARDLLLTVQDAHARIAYWELAEASVARGRAFAPDGRTVLRLVSMKPSWDGAEHFEQELEVEGLVGRRALVLPDGATHPRVAIGWRSRAGFLPLAVAVDVGATGEVEFVPPHAREADVERALQHARSAARG